MWRGRSAKSSRAQTCSDRPEDRSLVFCQIEVAARQKVRREARDAMPAPLFELLPRGHRVVCASERGDRALERGPLSEDVGACELQVGAQDRKKVIEQLG